MPLGLTELSNANEGQGHIGIRVCAFVNGRNISIDKTHGERAAADCLGHLQIRSDRNLPGRIDNFRGLPKKPTREILVTTV